MPVPYGSKLHVPPTNYYFLAVQQQPYKSLFLSEKCWRTFWKISISRTDH